MLHMPKTRVWLPACWAWAVALLVTDVLWAQAVEEQTVKPPAPTGPARKLAPGVETTIDAKPVSDPEDYLVDYRPDPDLLRLAPKEMVVRKDPTQPMAEVKDEDHRVRAANKVWGLEFTFKPMRFMPVTIPDGKGGTQTRLVWYMVYHVANLSTRDDPEPTDGSSLAKRNHEGRPVRFIPVIWFESRERPQVVHDRLMPSVVPLIQKREDPHRPLLNTVQITGFIPPTTKNEDHRIWGVATWVEGGPRELAKFERVDKLRALPMRTPEQDHELSSLEGELQDFIDPRTDRFSVCIKGLTNIVQKPDTPDKPLKQKTLVLDFWRPSDTRHEHEKEIKFEPRANVDDYWQFR